MVDLTTHCHCPIFDWLQLAFTELLQMVGWGHPLHTRESFPMQTWFPAPSCHGQVPLCGILSGPMPQALPALCLTIFPFSGTVSCWAHLHLSFRLEPQCLVLLGGPSWLVLICVLLAPGPPGFLLSGSPTNYSLSKDRTVNSLQCLQDLEPMVVIFIHDCIAILNVCWVEKKNRLWQVRGNILETLSHSGVQCWCN